MTHTTPPTGADGLVLAERYELRRPIGRGGMADVYEARDRRLGRRVAVKVFRGAAPSDRARFDAEVRTLASLSHPSLVEVYDAGDHDGDAFVVLELIEGPTAAACLADNGALPVDVVAEVGACVADALAFVHEHGVVHRDVTPANILCAADGRPRLADFGIARLVDTTRITAPETAVGTAAYMAPEQVQGLEVTPAADVYSLGLVLLELLTGRRGFDGPPHEAAVARLVRAPDVTRGVPGPWRGLLADMTERAPADRPLARAVAERLRALGTMSLDAPTAGLAVADDVAADSPTVVDGTAVLPVALVPDSTGTRPPRWRRVAPALAALALAAAALAAGAVTGDGHGADPPSSTTDTTPAVASPPPSTTVPATTSTAETTTTTKAAKPDKGDGGGRGKKAGPHG